MQRLRKLIQGSEGRLMKQIAAYAIDRGYAKYTSTLEEAWRVSISGLSSSLYRLMELHSSPPELGPDEDYSKDPVAAFGIKEAQLHRARGISLGMFLGLLKYYKQSYIDLVLEAGFEKEYERRSCLFIERFFDRLELGFCMEWTAHSTTDVTAELQANNRAMTNEKNKYLTIYESIPCPVVLLDENSRIDGMNHAATELLRGALSPGAAYYGCESVGEAPPWLACELTAFLNSDEPEVSVEKGFETENGTRHYHVRLKRMLDISHKFKGTVIILDDVTEKRVYEQTLDRLAHHDSLTGLPNRLLFSDRLNQAIARSRRERQGLAVLFIDLDGFKLINDSLGHDVGDALLMTVAKRLVGSVRKSDTVARMGGDEFIVVLPGVGDTGEAATAADKLLSALTRPCNLDGNDIEVSASIGVSLHPQDGPDVEALVRSADAAMYRAKQNGKNQFHFYSAADGDEATERLAVERGLREALEQDHLRVHFQPRVDIMSGEIVGAEALVRWDRPGLGLVMPDQFIKTAEQSGLMGAIDEWVLRSVCRQSACWGSAGLGPVRVSVNLSNKQLRNPELVGAVRSALEETGLDPDLLDLDITETAVMEQPDLVSAVLSELKALGVRLAIDDFGSGYSSLNILKSLPIDAVKLERGFVREIADKPDEAAMAGALVAMAHSLKLTVVAKGVETLEQLKFLRSLQCDEVQGYFISRPVQPGEFEHQMRARTRQAGFAANV